MARRAWRYRLYPSKAQCMKLNRHLNECKTLWNSLLEHTKAYYEETGKFPARKQLYLLTKGPPLFSQVAQNIADRLSKSLRGMIARKKAGMKFGFPRFKSFDRIKSFTYPQFGFQLREKLKLAGIGRIAIRKHRNIQGKVKTLTIKKAPSGKWFAIFTSEIEKAAPIKNRGPKAGMDLGIEHFAYLSDGKTIENARHLQNAEQKLKESQKQLSNKKKGSRNRRKARIKVATVCEKLTNRRSDFLHKASRKLAENYSLIAMEDLNTAGLSREFLAKHVLDCSWAKFSSMLHYKAEEAGCEIVLVNPAHTTQQCSSCGQMHKKSLAERWHECPCGASMHRDLNAAINMLNRATGGTPGSQACVKERSSLTARGSNSLDLRRGHYPSGQAFSMKQEAHVSLKRKVLRRTRNEVPWISRE